MGGIVMAAAGLRFESSRELLSQAIVESLKSWPEFQRRIFIEIHYRARSVEEVSRALGVQQTEVIEILQRCERKLHRALKVFRDRTSSEVSEEPPQSLACATGACLR
jgi:DNA-directed RNA polymerase specialized sigma24 family protein